MHSLTPISGFKGASRQETNRMKEMGKGYERKEEGMGREGKGE